MSNDDNNYRLEKAEIKNIGSAVGAPEFKFTEQDRMAVAQMASVGIPQQDIAMVIQDGIAPKTLRKHFRRELDTAKVKANTRVGRILFQKILDGDTTAAIFWAKTQMGWKEKSEYELSGQVEINEVRRIVVYPDQS
jgi:hypothetical protein